MNGLKPTKRVRTDCLVNGDQSSEISSMFTLLHDVLEKEFTCAICHEILMTSTVLGCGHCFCAYCIYTWLRRSPKCPMCSRSSHRVTHLKNVDNFIKQVYDLLQPTEMKVSRAQDLEHRARQTLLVKPDENTSVGDLTGSSIEESASSSSFTTDSSIFAISTSSDTDSVR
ncbi:hypothetical protein AHF37_03281 [Paragonimus kellicotti]|nr:hypothetical protein AHF37_03281 [Paragonimus kellicotti]